MRIFHLTYWYPNKRQPNEAVWIKHHIDSLGPYVDDQFVFHFHCGTAKRFSLYTDTSDLGHSSFHLSGPVPWRLIEILSFFGLVYLLLTRARQYDVVNVHIAYPLLTYFRLIERWIRKPVVVTEHWSGYHYNFGVKKSLPRIKKIFQLDLPLITVSQSLLDDIERFSGCSFSTTKRIPNGVNLRIFHRNDNQQCTKHVFFMLSQWKWPKRPDLLLEAFARLIHDKGYHDIKLRIGGYGNQLERIGELVSVLKLSDNVTMLGVLSSEAIANEMNKCTAFVHASDYETFSVVCAEAICCGAPVIASKVGALPEFINRENGLLVEGNTTDAWVEALLSFRQENYDRSDISVNAGKKFSFEVIGKQYFLFLKSICEAY